MARASGAQVLIDFKPWNVWKLKRNPLVPGIEFSCYTFLKFEPTKSGGGGKVSVMCLRSFVSSIGPCARRVRVSIFNSRGF